MTKILQAVAQDIYCIVDYQESIVFLLWKLDFLDGRILSVVLLQIRIKGLIEAGVYGTSHIGLSL